MTNEPDYDAMADAEHDAWSEDMAIEEALEKERSRQWRPIETAPKDGRLIELCAMGTRGPEDRVSMRWSPTMRNGMFPGEQGFWVTECGGVTWNPRGDGGPTHWSTE